MPPLSPSPPAQTRYLESRGALSDPLSLERATAEGVGVALASAKDGGSILVFLPGARALAPSCRLVFS